MNIALLNAGFDSDLESEEQLLARYWHIPNLAAALAELGHRVVVVQAFHRSGTRQDNAVRFEFVAPANPGRGNWIEFSGFGDIAPVLQQCRPHAVHLFGLSMPALRRDTGRWCRRHDALLCASYHGGRPPRRPLQWWRMRRSLRDTSVFCFPDAASAGQWRTARLVPRQSTVCELPEVSSAFSGIEKLQARRMLGIDGNPVLAWAGRLNANKDPLTALRAMTRIVREWPHANIVFAFQSGELLPAVNAFLDGHDELSGRITLLGRRPHDEMQALFSAADFFVHTSHREWGSNVLVEAMACGAIPATTNIPSLCALTRTLDCAMSFGPGDDESLAAQLLAFPLAGIERASAAVKSEFRERLSYRAIARAYTAALGDLVSGRNS